MKKLLTLLLVCAMLLTGIALAKEEAPAHKPVAILFTNDMHCSIRDGIGFAGVAAYKAAYEQAGYDVLLVDVGDAIQGQSLGTISRGEYVVYLMNEVGYDVATIGNHEFDYTLDRFYELQDMANYDYVCCNFTDLEGNALMTPYVIREIGGWKVAFIGITTPETFTKSTPTFFQDDQGNYIYSFNGGNGGEDLYPVVQKYVDQARAEGAEIVVALAHLGDEYIAPDKAWTCADVITHTNGIDVALDGHAHHFFAQVPVLNKDGVEVMTASTGTQLENIGLLTINEGEEGGFALETSLHNESIFQDAVMTAKVDGVYALCNVKLQEVVAHTDIDLIINDPTAKDENGNAVRIIRSQETNLGDLCADAYRAIGQADIGVVNGGGVRATIPAGDITYEHIIKVHPYGNMLTVVEATGQQILDLLEMSVSKLPAENGGFQHVSGMSFTVDMSVESTVEVEEHGDFVAVRGDRRVKDVMVGGEPIDPEKIYTIASHNYMLLDGGDGLNMFKGDNVLMDSVMLDNQVLINYITEYLNGSVGEEYAEPYGQGRINIING